MTPGIPRPSQSCRGSTNATGRWTPQGVDLEIRLGELVALLGPNGAGKTTAVSVLLGQRRPDAGSARLFGRDPTLPAARRAVGVTLQESGFPDNLTVAEVIDLVRIHYPHPAPTRDLLDRFGLAEVAGRRAGGLSGGQQRRLAVALAFAGGPGRWADADQHLSQLVVQAVCHQQVLLGHPGRQVEPLWGLVGTVQHDQKRHGHHVAAGDQARRLPTTAPGTRSCRWPLAHR